MVDLNIQTETTTTVRELEPGTYYVNVGTYRNTSLNRIAGCIRVKTEDPFNSTTIHGSRVRSFPSEKVHPVEIKATSFKEAEIYGVNFAGREE